MSAIPFVICILGPVLFFFFRLQTITASPSGPTVEKLEMQRQFIFNPDTIEDMEVLGALMVSPVGQQLMAMLDNNAVLERLVRTFTIEARLQIK
jgi:hypothetical protein